MSVYTWLLRYNRVLPCKRWIHKNIVTPMPFQTRKKTLSIMPFQESMQMVIEKIASGIPFMLGRYGFTELRNICRISTEKKRRKLFRELCINAGFFPQDISLLPRFIELYKKVEQNLDILLPWSYRNDYVHNERTRIAGLQNCEYLCNIGIVGGILGYPPESDIENDNSYHNYAYFVRNSYLSKLNNKKVLVISPFKKSILKQYRTLTERGILPSFKSFTVLQAVQSIGNTVVSEYGGGYQTWFDALEDMHCQMQAIDFDIAFIGCGAYGMPLASYAKDLGKQALHSGGATQLLFAIHGARWEGLRFKEDFWIRPSIDERPRDYLLVENGCYW